MGFGWAMPRGAVTGGAGSRSLIAGCVAIVEIQNEANFAELRGRREIVVKRRTAGGGL